MTAPKPPSSPFPDGVLRAPLRFTKADVDAAYERGVEHERAEMFAAGYSTARCRVSEHLTLEQQVAAVVELHTDSPMGPCPVCVDSDDLAAGGDGLVDYPCPTLRALGVPDCLPRAALTTTDEETTRG